MHSAIFSTKAAEIDGSALGLFRNRSAYIAQSAATVGRLPAHPPVPRDRSLVPTVAADTGSPLVRSSSPDDSAAATSPNDTFEDYGRMMCDGYSFKYES